MFRHVKQIVVALSLVVVFGAVITPAALAWGPAGSDGWYLGPNGGWYQGMPWWDQSYTFASPGYYPDGYSNYWYPYPGYDQYQYEGYYVPYYTPPVAQPYIQVQPLPLPPQYQPYQSGAYYSCQPPAVPDRFHIPWGTFGTYDNWAREFYKQHGRFPNDQDVRDFWYSQHYAATHCGHAPW